MESSLGPREVCNFGYTTYDLQHLLGRPETAGPSPFRALYAGGGLWRRAHRLVIIQKNAQVFGYCNQQQKRTYIRLVRSGMTQGDSTLAMVVIPMGL